MFFLHELEHIVTLHPSFLGPRVNDYIERQLINDLEGTFNGKFLIVCILSSMDISEGRVVPSTSQSEFVVHYKAVVWKPFKGEIVRWNKSLVRFLLTLTDRWSRTRRSRQWLFRRDRAIECLRFQSGPYKFYNRFEDETYLT